MLSDTIWAGASPTVPIAVRSTGWRRTSSVNAAPSLPTSSGPRRRCADGTLNTVRPSCSCSRYHTRCCISDSGAGSVVGRGVIFGGASISRASEPSSQVARPATVECSKPMRIGTGRPSARASFAVICATSSEWPPSAKKSSWMPSARQPSASMYARATSSSVGVRGATTAPGFVVAGPDGAGSALRSTLPFGVSGSAVERHEARRDHVVGQRVAQVLAQDARRSAPAPRPTT